jgi:SAM-dependent methyltransferase
MEHLTTEHEIQWDSDKIGRLWDYYSSHALPFGSKYFAQSGGARIVRLSGLPTRPLRALDFGCGPGYLFDHIARLRPNWRFCGVDFSDKSVAAARQRYGSYSGFGSVERISSLPTPFEAQSFDVIFAVEVVEHLNDTHLQATLAEFRRLLRPGGTLCITTPNSEELEDSKLMCPECGARFHIWQHVRSWTEASLDRYVSAYGFRLRNSRATDLCVDGFISRAMYAARRMLGRPAPQLMLTFTAL